VDLDYPAGRKFAFTVFDDTDVATIENVKPIYDLLRRLGMRTTKTAWVLPCPDPNSDFVSSQTLNEPDYLAFVQDLQRNGFEIAWHGAGMESSLRGQTLEALERFKQLFGGYPRAYANHANNRENIYWGTQRVDASLLKLFLKAKGLPGEDVFSGHSPESPHFWGDFCATHIEYVRNLTFNNLNLQAVNPSMPYRDPRRPMGRRWFSAADAENVHEFIWLLRPEQQERLEAEGGFSIVATHFGKGFVVNGRVHPEVEKLLSRLATRPGWFPTVGELLDWLAARRESDRLPWMEWQRMQWKWIWDLSGRKLRRHATRSHPKPATAER
jgi:hypothetical protein